MLTRIARALVALLVWPFARLAEWYRAKRTLAIASYWRLRGWGDVLGMLTHCTVDIDHYLKAEADSDWNRWLLRRGMMNVVNGGEAAKAALAKPETPAEQRPALISQVAAMQAVREDFESRVKPLWTLAGLVEWCVLDVLKKPTCGCSARADKLNGALPIHPPKLAIVLPHYRDRRACWHTLMSLRDQILNYGLQRYVHLIVVDQSPIIDGDPRHADGTPWSPMEVTVNEIANAGVLATWLNYPEPLGTAPAKRRGAQEAAALGCRWTLIVDCHVHWADGNLKRLLKWIRNPANVESPHVYHGALLDPTGNVIATHQALFNRDGTPIMGTDLLWGGWSVADDLKRIVGTAQTAEIESGPGFVVMAQTSIAVNLYHPEVRGHGDPEGFISRRHMAANATKPARLRGSIYLHGLLGMAHNFMNDGQTRSTNNARQACKNHCIECSAQAAILHAFAARVIHQPTGQPHPSWWSVMRARWSQQLDERTLLEIEREVTELGLMVPPYFGPPAEPVAQPQTIDHGSHGTHRSNETTLPPAESPELTPLEPPRPTTRSQALPGDGPSEALPQETAVDRPSPEVTPTAVVVETDAAPWDGSALASPFRIVDDKAFMAKVDAGKCWARPLRLATTSDPVETPKIDRMLAICCASGNTVCADSICAQFLMQKETDCDLLIIDDTGSLAAEVQGDHEGRAIVVKQLGERTAVSNKHRLAVQYAIEGGYQAVAIMDDDDFHFPLYLSSHLAALRNGYQWSAPNRAYYCHGGDPGTVTIENAERRWHAAWAFTTALYQRAGGYPPDQWTAFDTELGARFELLGVRPVDPWSYLSPQHVYRFGVLRPSSSGLPSVPGRLPDVTPPDKPHRIAPHLDQHAQRIRESIERMESRES